MAVVDSAAHGLAASRRANVIQLRAPLLTVASLEREARRLVASRPPSVKVLISARCDIALTTGADGVNLPAHDIAIADARALLGGRVVGRSVHSLVEAERAEREGADYVIFGPVWASRSHPDATPKGLDALSRVARRLSIPVVAIGGMTEHRIAEVRAAGAAGHAAIDLYR